MVAGALICVAAFGEAFSAWLSGTSTFGCAAGPIISGAIAGFSIRSIFIVNSVIYLLMIGFVHRNVRH